MKSPFHQKSLPPMSEADWAILELQRMADWASRQTALYVGETKAHFRGLARGYGEAVTIIRKLRSRLEEGGAS